MTVQDYIDLLTSEYTGLPNFTAVISNDVGVQVQVQDLMEEMIPLFDLDVAVGNQLDILGQWVGVSRNVSIPISGIFFTWDGLFTEGWDFGTWSPAITPTTITVLPDDAYLTLIRAKIAANHWDGTTEGAYAIWDALFPQFTILIQDNQDMTYALAIVGGIVDSLTLALLTGGYIPLRPEGVMVTEYIVPINDGPLFAWDVAPTSLLAGWDTGNWGRELPPT